MAKLALYQKYRPQTFDEVVGQEYVVRSIRNAVHENKVGHAYLFCGPRGTGKTTMARILAKAVNCEHPENSPCEECANCIAANEGTHPDIVEINAANETHIEDIRDLIERSTLAPMQGAHKVYIIDEVHQLSSAASSALLKTLEEPPENVIFILATTDPQKLLSTIISRCQRFDFTEVKKEQIQAFLLHIAEEENIKMEESAAEMISELAQGGMRDALSIMDQCASYTSDDITADAIDRIYGLTGSDEKIGMIKDIFNQDFESILKRTESYEQKGIDLPRFTDGMIDILKDAVIYSNTKKTELLKMLSKEQAEDLSKTVSSSTCMHMCEKLLDTKAKFKSTGSANTCFSVACLSFAAENVQDAPLIPAPAVKHASIPAPKKAEPVIEQTVTEEPITESIEEESEPEPIIEEVPMIDEQTVLSILIQCNKQEKAKDEPILSDLNAYRDLSNQKYISLLSQTSLAASGQDCILLNTSSLFAKRINTEEMNKEMYFFFRDVLHIDKMIYACDTEEYKNAVNAYRSAVKNQTPLPEPMKIERYTEEAEGKKETSQDKVLNLFGEENVEII